MKILFVCARFPYPPLKGDQVRAYHQLRLLSARHKITLLSFADGTETTEQRLRVASFCERVILVPLTRKEQLRAIASGALSDLPFQTLLYNTQAMKKAVRQTLGESTFDVAHIQLARMAPHLESQTLPRVVDLIDALSLNMARRAQEERGIMRRLARLEQKRMNRSEKSICERFEQVTVVSQVDRDAVGNYANLHLNPNGVEADDFPFTVEGREANTLVFSGNMGYFPNVNAVLWFAEQVLPRIRNQVPDVRFQIVGANPTREVRALAERDNSIEVTGFVPDLRLYLAGAQVAVAPMRAGSGIQNKVIEAMSSGAPVVSTPFALGGLSARHEEHLLVGEDAASFAEQTVRLVKDESLRQRLAKAARHLVETEYSWETSVARLEEIYQAAIAAKQLSRT
jgi:sugar transferase (PEP-CTERM/EpsH1 system associated)